MTCETLGQIPTAPFRELKFQSENNKSVVRQVITPSLTWCVFVCCHVTIVTVLCNMLGMSRETV